MDTTSWSSKRRSSMAGFLQGIWVRDNQDRSVGREYLFVPRINDPVYNMVYKPEFSEGYCRAFMPGGKLDIIDFLLEENIRSKYGVGFEFNKPLPVELLSKQFEQVAGNPNADKKTIIIGKNRLKEHV